jgi:hypothetical protein
MFGMALLLLVQDAPKVSDAKVDAAVERGAKYLVAAHNSGGASHPEQGAFSLDELVLYTLLHAGTDPKDPAVARLVDRITTKAIDRTYHAAVTAMALEAYDARSYQWRIAQCAQFLVDNQANNGQWSYGKPIKLPSNVPSGPPSGGGGASTKSLPAIRIKRQSKGPEVGDNSNSQYAALGLRACAKASVTVPDETVALAAKWWEGAQQADGGWGYGEDGGAVESSYGAMTAGGTASLHILKEMQKQKSDAARRGLDWMAANLDFGRNPGYRSAWMWQFYWIYAVERAGDLAGVDRIGTHWWYAEGAEYLFGAQKGDGSWIGLSGDGKESVGGAVADTCFAILFLRRATKARPKVASGK